MRKWLIPLAVIVGLVLILFLIFQGTYNKMVTKEESVTAQWAKVEDAYERKYKLLPNLVSTASNYAEFEKEVLTEVTEARSRASSVQVNPENMTPEQLQQFEQSQQQLSGAFSRLLLTFERYPNLKASDLYKEVQAELSGSENRISVARQRFIDEVQGYNTYIRKFPQNMLAGIYGFEKKPTFEASEEAKKNEYDVDEDFDQ